MESAKRACSSIIYGLKDCICGMLPILKYLAPQKQGIQNVNIQPASVRNINSQSTIRDKLIGCATFGICFWLCNFVFDLFFIQWFFQWLVQRIGADPNSLSVIWNRRILYIMFLITLISPLLVISKLLNFIWYQDVADFILAQSGVRRNTNVRISDFYADIIKSLFLQIIYCLQGYAVYFLPVHAVLQYIWYLFHLSLLTSLYAFEYKWVHIGWPLHRRLLNINRKWPYYLGFGAPLAFVTTMFDSFTESMIVFATLFPMYIVSSTVTPDVRSPIFRHQFNTFIFADSASDVCIKFLFNACPALVSFFKR